MSQYIIGLDVGGTKCAVTLGHIADCEPKPVILGKVKFPTVKGDPHGTLKTFAEQLDVLLDEAKLTYSDVSGIGISCGGPLNSQTGVVMSPPNLIGWDDIHICEFFEKRTGIPTRLENDANACAVAEWKYGAGRGTSNMVFLTFGTGLGAGLILDGKLYCGANDNAGEIGHVRLENDGPVGYGKRGSCEGFCSGGGIAQLGVMKMHEDGPDGSIWRECNGDENSVTAKLLGDMAERGDASARSVYDRCAHQLGRTLAILCDVLDPELIILGGIYMRSADLLASGLTEVLCREALMPCPVVAAGLGETIGDYAAMSVAPLRTR